jgi:hypothetical protein
MSMLSMREKIILEELSELVFSGGLSPDFITNLRTISIRATGQEITRELNINSLPNEILSIIFDYTGKWKPLIKFTCYRWSYLLNKCKYDRDKILGYNSETVIGWICKGIDYSKLRDINVKGMLSKNIENSLMWFIKNSHNREYSGSHSLHCQLFCSALECDCSRIAKYIYYDMCKNGNYGESGIRVRKKHFMCANNAGNLDMFMWLNEISKYKFENTHILMGIIIHPSIISYAQYRGFVKASNDGS